ncbi:hypothetical protein HC891_09885 [Candidatus Gracilibacteria bacterium]|nr:hypothetical protein [Candidatus Gracilibacteria bacterium]
MTVIGDTFWESDETFELRLSNSFNALVSDSEGLATIQNDDAQPVVEFAAATQVLSENIGAAAFDLMLSAPSALPITVSLSLTGTTTAADHTLTAGQIVIPAGNSGVNVPFSLIDDMRDEVDETLILTLSAAQNAALGATSAQTITIVDDDEYTLRFSQSQYTVGEAAGSVIISVTLESALPYTVTVDYLADVSAEGTATITDFTPISGTLRFAPGVTSASFAVTVMDDLVEEKPRNDTVALRLSSADGAIIAAPNPVVLTIVDDDAPIPGEDEGLNFYMTGGKNRTEGNDTWYARNGSYDYFEIGIPCGLPRNEPVYIDLFEPAINDSTRDRIIGDKDTTRFSLYADRGATILITPTVFASNTYTNAWVRFATIDATSCGVYELRSETLDDDSNGWSLRVSRDMTLIRQLRHL